MLRVGERPHIHKQDCRFPLYSQLLSSTTLGSPPLPEYPYKDLALPFEPEDNDRCSVTTYKYKSFDTNLYDPLVSV